MDQRNAGSSVAEVTRHDKFFHGQIANEAGGAADRAEAESALHQLAQLHFEECACMPASGKVQQHLEQLPVLLRRHQLDGLATPRPDHDPDQVELPLQGLEHPFETFVVTLKLFGFQMQKLGRVIEHVEKLLEALTAELVTEQLLDERAKSTRRIVDHMPQLLVLAMNVRDHVDHSLRKTELRLQGRNLRHRRIDGGKALGKDSLDPFRHLAIERNLFIPGFQASMRNSLCHCRSRTKGRDPRFPWTTP